MPWELCVLSSAIEHCERAPRHSEATSSASFAEEAVAFVVISVYLAQVPELIARVARRRGDHPSFDFAYVASVSNGALLDLRQGVPFFARDRPIFVVNLRS